MTEEQTDDDSEPCEYCGSSARYRTMMTPDARKYYLRCVGCNAYVGEEIVTNDKAD